MREDSVELRAFRLVRHSCAGCTRQRRGPERVRNYGLPQTIPEHLGPEFYSWMNFDLMR